MTHIIYQSRVYRPDLEANPTVLYVFGDNVMRAGLGGQAKEMRGEPNAFGVATLEAPGVPWTDEGFTGNCQAIDTDLRNLYYRRDQFEAVVFPIDGIGTGLSLLNTEAPRTFAYLNDLLKNLFNIRNPLNA